MDGRSKAQVKAQSRASSYPIASKGLLQRKCTECKKKKKPLMESRDFGPVEGVQRMPAISQPEDPYEQEADRIAEAVVGGKQGLNYLFPSSKAPKKIQRLEREKEPKSNEEKVKEAVGKVPEALMKTDAGKEVKDYVSTMAKNATSKPSGKVIAGALAASAVSAIYATNFELPMQLPEIPLDFIYQGLKVKLTYEGPAQSPRAASLTIIFEESSVAPQSNIQGAPEAAGGGGSTGGGAGATPGTAPGSVRSDDAMFSNYAASRLKSPQQMVEERNRNLEGTFRKIEKGMPTSRNEMPSRGWGYGYDPSRSNQQLGAEDGPNRLRPESLRPPMVSEKNEQSKRKEEDLNIQRKEIDGEKLTGVPPIISEAIKSPSQPLNPEMRTFMEEHFGYDFGHVRIHTGEKAKESARAVKARAFTVGQDIILGAGENIMVSNKQLLAHELVHTIQQRGAEAKDNLLVEDSNNIHEVQARMLAGRIISIKTTPIIAESRAITVQRDDDQEAQEKQKLTGPGRWIEILHDAPESDPSSEAIQVCNEIDANRQSIRTRFMQRQGASGYMYTADAEAIMPRLKGKEAEQFRTEHQDFQDVASAASEYSRWSKKSTPSAGVVPSTEGARGSAQGSIWKALAGEGDPSAINAYDQPEIANFTWGRGFATSGGQLQNIIASLFAKNSDIRDIFLKAGISIDTQTKEFLVADTDKKYKARGKAAQSILRLDKQLISLFVNVAQGTFLGMDEAKAAEIRQAVFDVQIKQIIGATANFPDFALSWSDDARALAAHNIHLGGTTFRKFKTPWHAFEGISGDLKSVVRRIGEVWKSFEQNGAIIANSDVTKNRLIERAGGIAMKELDGPVDMGKGEKDSSMIRLLNCVDQPSLEGLREPATICKFRSGKVYFKQPGSRDSYYVLKD